MHKRTPGQGPDVTAGNYGQGGIWGRFRDQTVPKEIIPAIRP